MKNIWRLFARDVCHATRNVIAIIVLMGLVIVPALYAWYNIAASWDPYGNTKALKVAVANSDKGYKSDLIPVRINVGETVISSLRANHDLDWQFVDRDKAIDGVNSGEYYAALIIPKQFSADMMTLFSADMQHAELEYYLNEKVNPIAPHITDQGASTVATTIDQTFTKTLAQVGLDLASNMLKFAQSPQSGEYMKNASEHIASISQQLKGASAQAEAYANLLGSTGKIIDSTEKLLGSAGSAASGAGAALDQGTEGANGLKKALSGASSSASHALKQASSAYDDVSKQVDNAFNDMSSQKDQVVAKLNDLSGDVRSQADAFGSYASSLRDIAASVSDANGKAALEKAAQQAENTQNNLDAVATSIDEAATKIANDASSVESARADVKAQITKAKQSVSQASDTYENTLKPQLAELSDSVDNVVKQSNVVINGLDKVTSDVSGLSGNVSDGLEGAQSTLRDASKTLTTSANKLDDLQTQFSTLTTSGGSMDLSQFASSDSDTIATLISAPVSVDRIAIYPSANYGSAMTPFYTVLSIWVGSIVLVAMMKVAISDREKAKILGLGESLPLGETMGVKEAMIAGRAAGPGAMLDVLRKPRPESPGNARRFGLHLYQEYFGRYTIFGVMALLQGTLVCLGDMFFLGVQCEHPLQFLMTGWLTAIVFSLLIYTLTVSFGDIGKAIAVVLLVIQVAGSGGTFPIETLPPFFQAICNWLLFPYAVDAMHSAMAGSYGMEYWVAMGKLALFIVPVLLLGLVLRKPVIRLNDWVIHNLESTKVM